MTSNLITTSSRMRLSAGPAYLMPKSKRMMENSACAVTCPSSTLMVAGKEMSTSLDTTILSADALVKRLRGTI